MLNLEKLRASELPSKEIEVSILGEKQTVKVVAANDSVAFQIALLAQKAEGNPEVIMQIQRIALKAYLPELSDDDRELLLARAMDAVAEITNAGNALTAEWRNKRNEVAEQAEKNLPTVGSPSVTD